MEIEWHKNIDILIYRCTVYMFVMVGNLQAYFDIFMEINISVDLYNFKLKLLILLLYLCNLNNYIHIWEVPEYEDWSKTTCNHEVSHDFSKFNEVSIKIALKKFNGTQLNVFYEVQRFCFWGEGKEWWVFRNNNIANIAYLDLLILTRKTDILS